MEIETNIRIVNYGPNLYIRVREAVIEGADLSPDIVQRACRSLQFRRGVAAIPHPTQNNRLLIARPHPIKDMSLKESNWAVQIKDSGRPSRQYYWSNPDERVVVTQLIERALQAQLATQTDFWTLDSPHIWYEPEPFKREDGIAAYRRYTIGAIAIDDVGVGIITEVSTAFFTEQSLSHFFAEDINQTEQQRRKSKFQHLTSRQQGKKGTLLYHIQDHRGKCYFDDAPSGKTCATTGEIRFDSRDYKSLVEYYQEKFPAYNCDPKSRAVRVSFPGYKRPSWVSADCLFVRVMNDALPKSLKRVDKISPRSRRSLALRFWKKLGSSPFGAVTRGVKPGFWRPDPERILQFNLPELLYPDGQRLQTPELGNIEAYRNYFDSRLAMLDELGCYDSPPGLPRVIHLAYPEDLPQEHAIRFVEDLTARLCQLTRKPIQVAEPIVYQSVDEATSALAERGAQVVVFILNDDPTAYHKATFNQKWHVKRVTQNSLLQHVGYIKNQYRRWESYITMNALGVVQLYNAVPFALPCVGQYEAQLMIDVGHDRRHYALSLLIARDHGEPRFSLFTEVLIKPDPQHDTINPTILKDAIVALFRRVMGYDADPLKSLLVLRDGEFRILKEGVTLLREEDGVCDAADVLKSSRLLEQDVEIHLTDFRKQTNRTIRFWLVDEKANRYDNPLEGTAVVINEHYISLCTTGAATLRQGTAHPVVVTGNGHCPDIVEAGRSVFHAAQLNWSSPRVAQRLPQTIRAADEKLQAREAQEIRRIRR